MREYNAKKVSLVIGGRLISGFATDSMVRIAREVDSFDDKIGVDGKVSVSHSNDKRGTVTIKLMDTSPDNGYLSAFVNVSEATGKLQTFNMSCIDSQSGAIYESVVCWTKRPADTEKNKEVSEKEWMIRCEELIMIEGEL